MTKQIELWLHLHAFRNGLFEVSPNGGDTNRQEIPAHLVERFHTDPSRPNKALFRVPEYLMVGLGIYAPRPVTGIAARSEKPADSIHSHTELKPTTRAIFDESALYRQISGGEFETHNDGASILDSAQVIRSPIERAMREARNLSTDTTYPL